MAEQKWRAFRCLYCGNICRANHDLVGKDNDDKCYPPGGGWGYHRYEELVPKPELICLPRIDWEKLAAEREQIWTAWGKVRAAYGMPPIKEQQ